MRPLPPARPVAAPDARPAARSAPRPPATRRPVRPLPTAALLAALLAGCATPRPPEPAPAPALPAAWSEALPEAAEAPSADWWRHFGSPQLDRLVAAAEAGSADLRQAAIRVRQAELALDLAGAATGPTLGASAGSSLARSDASGARASTRRSSSLGLSLSYELDLWGRLQAGVDAAEAGLQASRHDQAAARLSLQGSVASTYLQRLGTAERLRIARANLALAERVLGLVSARQRLGVASALELSQQRSTVLSQRAALLPLELQLRQTGTALALLLGVLPQDLDPALDRAAERLDQLAVPAVAPGLPSSLLTRRPDLAAAEARLQAAAADLQATRAALLPSIGLSASGGLSSAALLRWVDPASSLSLGATLAQTLFDGGRRRTQVAISASQRELLLSSYGQAVRTALKEVDDSLGSLDRSRRQEEAQRAIVAEAERTLRLAELRYRSGSGELLGVLDAQRQLFSAQDSLASQRQARLGAAVDLFKALGGGWTPGRGAADGDGEGG